MLQGQLEPRNARGLRSGEMAPNTNTRCRVRICGWAGCRTFGGIRRCSWYTSPRCTKFGCPGVRTLARGSRRRLNSLPIAHARWLTTRDVCRRAALGRSERRSRAGGDCFGHEAEAAVMPLAAAVYAMSAGTAAATAAPMAAVKVAVRAAGTNAASLSPIRGRLPLRLCRYNLLRHRKLPHCCIARRGIQRPDV